MGFQTKRLSKMYVTVDLNRWKPIKTIKKVSKAILKTRVRDPLAFQESFLSETQLTRRTTPFDDDDLSPQLVYIIIVSSVLFVSIRAQFKVPRPSATDSTKTWQERERFPFSVTAAAAKAKAY